MQNQLSDRADSDLMQLYSAVARTWLREDTSKLSRNTNRENFVNKTDGKLCETETEN